MSIVTDVVANMLNGVSRQPPALRSTSQAQEQLNFDPSLTDGLVRRPSADRKYGMFTDAAQGSNEPMTFVIERGPGEAYVIVMTGTAVYGYRQSDGANVQFQDANGVPLASWPTYLTGTTTPREVFRAATVADTTFIVNRTQLVALTPGNTFNSVQVFQAFSDLPTTGAANVTYKILGNDGVQSSAYYVEWDGSGYVETLEPNAVDVISGGPYRFQVTGVNTIRVTQIPWVQRAVGDRENNPSPAFMGQGRTIQDVFFFRGRLGFITKSGFSMSRAGDYYNFYRKTATDVLDDDPINYEVSHTKSFVLNHAVPFDRSLLLFGSTTQFELSAGDVLSPRSVRADPITEFECDPHVRPIVVGNSIYFVQQAGDYTKVHEYFVDSDTVVKDAVDLTAHCPMYIKGAPLTLSGSALLNRLVVRTTDPQTIYVYKFETDGDNRRVQSAWFKYQIENVAMPLGAVWFRNELLLPCNVNLDIGQVEMLSMTYLEDIEEGGEVDYRMDRKHIGTFLQASGLGYSFVNLPYQPLYDGKMVVLYESAPGVWLPLKPQTGFVVSPDQSLRVNSEAFGGKRVMVGWPFESKYVLSRLYARDQNGAARLKGRLQLRKLYVDVVNTSVLNIKYRPRKNQEVVRRFNAPRTGGILVGNVQAVSRRAAVTIHGNARDTEIEFQTDSHLPAGVASYEWVGEFARDVR